MKVIVYGTLKRGYGNNRLLQSSKFVEETEVEGFKLYYAGFPVAAPAEGEKITAEVWDIGEDQQVLSNLDRLESEGTMYHRVQVREDTYMYVGDNEYWFGFRHNDECPKDEQGRYVWGR